MGRRGVFVKVLCVENGFVLIIWCYCDNVISDCGGTFISV